MRKPLRIMITSECNNNCQYCFVKTSKNYHAEKGDAAAIKEAMKKVDYNQIEIIGGEPFHDIQLLEQVLDGNTKPVSFFTSGTYNQQEALEFCKKQDYPIFIHFSYDGKYSTRNRHNYQSVKDSMLEFKEAGFPINIRWSVTKDDISYLTDHYLEMIDLGFLNPIFFPMKNEDYTEVELSEFEEHFDRIIQYSIDKQINFMGILAEQELKVILNKKDFFCSDEITILPNGQFTNCYVSYSSYGFPNRLKSDSPVPSILNEKSPGRCSGCLNITQSCNKCIGNLEEYRQKTGNQFFNTYCDLMNRLAIVFIKRRMDYMPYSRFEYFTDGKITHIVQYSNGKIVKLKYDRDLL